MATLPVTSYYPLTYLPSLNYTQPVTFDPEYVNNLISLGVTDYFTPTQFATNPLFAQVDSFHQNVGILQTAVDSLDKVLTLVDDLKNITEPSEEIIQEFSDEINSILQNTTYNDSPVFNQTLTIGDQNIDLNVPLFNPDTYTIQEYEKLISEKSGDLFKALQNIDFSLPFSSADTYTSILQNPLIAYNIELLNPQTLELLLI